MGTSNLKRVSKGEMKGWMREEILNDLPSSYFDNPISWVQETGGEILKESTWRWAALLPLPNGRRVLLKRDRTKDWMEGLKYLFLPSKGQKEFLIPSQLKKWNLNIPQPLGWLERRQKEFIRESYYISEAIGTGVSFIEEVAKSKEPRSIAALAMTVRRCQDAGLFHQDLHGGNFLWKGDALLLTDLHHAKIIKSLSASQMFWNVSHLFHSLRSVWGEREQLQFLSQCFGEKLDDSQINRFLYQNIHPIMDRLQRRQWRSRTKRGLKESTEFTLQKEKGMRTFRRRDFSMDRLESMMEGHRDLIREKPSCLVTLSPEVIGSILNDGREKICLKQFCYPHIWGRLKENFRRSKGLKSWIAANGMRSRGLPTLKPLARVERKSWLGIEESTLFMEALTNDLEMDRYMLKGFVNLNQKRLFIKTFAHGLGGLHKMSLYHRDMKTCNILVSEREETWNFHLLDFEDIRMDEKVNRKKLIRNFLPLNTSTPKVMTNMDRYRFFRTYLHLNPIVKDPKGFVRKLWEKSRRRGLVYVSPEGVVTEAM